MRIQVSDRPMLRNHDNILIPQHYSQEKGVYEVTEGKYGSQSFIKRGSILVDFFEGNTTVTKDYNAYMYGLDVINDGESDLTIGVNSLNIIVKAGEKYYSLFDPFTTFTLTTTSAYRVAVLQ